MLTSNFLKPVHLKSLQNEYTDILYWFFLCGATFFIFQFDLNMPLGVAAGTPYALVVFGSLWLKGNQSTYIVVCTSTLLAIAGLFLSPGIVAAMDVVLANRLLALLIIACTAFMVLKIKKANQELTTIKTDIYFDPLTQCKTRRGFVMELATEIKRSTRYAHHLSLAIFDFDHSSSHLNNKKLDKQNNDLLIKKLSLEIGKSIRNSDQLYRISHDRFVVMFVETDIHEAKEASNALFEKISKINMLEDYPDFSVSVGMATLENDDNRRTLYTRAETALIKAKENGGNQVSTLPEITRNGKVLVPAILLRSRVS